LGRLALNGERAAMRCRVRPCRPALLDQCGAQEPPVAQALVRNLVVDAHRPVVGESVAQEVEHRRVRHPVGVGPQRKPERHDGLDVEVVVVGSPTAADVVRPQVGHFSGLRDDHGFSPSLPIRRA
jgi:hypothetical protein